MLVRSSWLVAALMLVSGVFTDEPPLTLSVGVLVDVDAPAAPLPLADCFAAFSARRFCFDAEGGMVVVGRQAGQAAARKTSWPLQRLRKVMKSISPDLAWAR